MRRVGGGLRRWKRMRRASRREILDMDRPYVPRACGTLQSRQIVQSRAKPPSARDLGWRIVVSIIRTSGMRVMDEGGCLSLFYSKALECQIRVRDQIDSNTGQQSLILLSLPSIAFPNEDAGVAKIIPPPVLFTSRRCSLSSDCVNASRSPSPSSTKTSRARGSGLRRDSHGLNSHRIRSLPTWSRQRRTCHS